MHLRAFALTAALLLAAPAAADETCQSPYLPKIAGQEDYVYVWTVGIPGLGDGSDKLVTVDVRPDSETFGKVVSSFSVGGNHEAHHGGLSDDRRRLWVGGLADSRIFIFDIASDPAKPKLVKTLTDFEQATGGVAGPHGFYALPGRMLISALSNAEDDGGRTALVEYNNDGEFIRTVWMPEGAEYGYDARVKPELNRLLTSSFAGRANYMRDLNDLMGDAEAMKNFGNTMVVWDFHALKPLQVLDVPGAPLEIRWALGPRSYYAFTASALTSKLWGVFRTDEGTFEAVELADIGNPEDLPLPVDISISSDDRHLFVATFMDGMIRVFDVSKPRQPREIYKLKAGDQVNMISQSWDGNRVYATSSLLSKWDHAEDQYMKAWSWDGKSLEPLFEIDFRAEGLGRPHIMRFGDVEYFRGLAEQATPGASGSPS
jgi:selenium-binding protein 1